MKVLFVSSGNSGSVSPIIKNQGDSLARAGVDIIYYLIKGKGIKGYFKSIIPLRRYLKNNSFDAIHAHYSLSAFVASLAGAKHLIVSLMGSDVKSSKCYKFLIRFFASFFSWKSIIVKSQDMYDDLGIIKAVIIPNGVDTERFKPMDKEGCQKKLSWDISKKHILFTSNPDRIEKNYKLALDSVNLIKNYEVELHYMKGVPNEETPIWYNAADVVLLTSLWEGSPNAIKEATVCNRPIVSTDVGDVRWNIGDTRGCYICSYEPQDCAVKIKQALMFSENEKATNGRKHIDELGLDNKMVAKKIIEIYKNISAR